MTSNPIMPLPPRNAQRDEQTIREQRRQFNESIAAHDVRRIGQCWLPDVQVSTSSGRPLVGRAAVQAAFEEFFADPTFVTFTRTTTQVTLSTDGNVAAEAGEWVGHWRKSSSPTTRHGVYLASWHRQGQRWLLQAELFVPLG